MEHDARILATTTERLSKAGCAAPDLEAAELMEVACDAGELAGLLERREDGVPIAWLVGSVTFCGQAVLVDEGVYVPRLQTEELARRAAAHLAPGSGTALDLCTGSGAVARCLMAAAPTARVLALDIDERAVRCARRNEVAVVRGDLGRAPLRPRSADLITAVAPYVPSSQLCYLPRDTQLHEPTRALDGGEDGLMLARQAARCASTVLRRGGALFLELGGDQDRLLEPVLQAEGFEVTDTWYDDDGDLRGVAARLASTGAG